MVTDRVKYFSFACSLGLASTALVLGACKGPPAEPDPGPKSSAIASSSSTPADPTELIKEDIKVGAGREVKTGDKLNVNYTGRLLKNNSKFDSNDKTGKPFPFTVGEGVIEGWSQGVLGMKPGGKRKLTIPAKLAYGEHGQPPKIPANAALVFDIELIGFQDGNNGTDAPATSASPSASAGPSAAPAAGSAKPAASSAPKK